MRVLVACEYSGRVRDAFLAKGHDAISCDLIDSEVGGPHHTGDVLDFIASQPPFDLMIAHPPCTYLCNSGVCWLYNKDATDDIAPPKAPRLNRKRWRQMRDGADFFYELLNSKAKKICIENPIMHRYAVERIGTPCTQIIQPWMFGHKEKKATCLWLKGLPLLVPTTNLKKETDALPKNVQQRLHYLPPGPNRWKERSRTYLGVAHAMAEQWGQQ